LDRHEALAVQAVFDGRAKTKPVTAIKSMLGETLGTSGATQALSLVEAMRDGSLPGISGLQSLEDCFPIGAASAMTQRLDLPNGLVSSVGFDGHSCSLVIERV
ncbi:MAG TPA: hypothetical protein VFV34_21330, partial [Blastocatellia bacterium]|nr:hypothetical protein [Blastocatellia bacterium]